MKLIHSDSEVTASQSVAIALLAVLFLIAPFYYQDNLGGEGMNLPFNAVVWIPVLLIIASAIFTLIQRQSWIKPRYLLGILILPVGLWVAGAIAGMDRPGEWLIRLGVVLGGVLLWFSLLQFRFNRTQLEQLFYLILASMLLHALVGLFQLTGNPLLRGWIPVSGDHRILGMFQQPNLQASLMATTIALSLWLATTSSFSQQRWPLKSVCYLALALASLEVAASGSRVGLLGSMLAVLLVVIGRFSELKADLRRTVLLVVVTVAGVISGYQVNDGALQAYNKIERMAQEGKDARPHIYQIAWDVFERSPVVGHGIGSFQREFQNERVSYYDGRDASAISGAPRFSHPHNELLFWMDEGGVIALAAILAAAIAVTLQLTKLGWREGAAGLALILPIALHTQVELPFYISTYHWIMLIMLLAVIFSVGAKEKNLTLSGGAQSLLSLSSLIAAPLLVMFLVHSLIAQTGVMNYIKSRGTQPTQLGFALNNIYFKELGEYFVMRSSLYGGIEQQNREAVSQFVDWAEPYLAQLPDIQLYRDLATAYQNLGDQAKAEHIIAQGHAIYPKEKGLLDAKHKLERGELLATSSLAAAPSED